MGRIRLHRHRPFLVALLALGVSLGVTTGFAASLPTSSRTLTVYRTCALSATPSTSTADVDSFVNQSNGTQNNGTATTMDSQSSNNANRRPYIRFDLTKCHPAIPSTATVKLATLRLFVTAIPGVCRTEDIFAATAPWTETGITWNNQPFGTTTNNPPSGGRTDAITIGAAPCQNTSSNTYLTGWNVTPDVQGFVAGTSTNNGWMIRDDAENSATARNARFSTKNANLIAQAPQLTIIYVT